MNRRPGLSLGVPTLMTAFVLLCMATFATLSLLSAGRDYDLTRRQAEAARAYYAADAAAETRLWDIGRAVELALDATDSADGFFTQLSHAGILWDSFERLDRGRGALVRFSMPVGEEQRIEAAYAVIYHADSHTASLRCESRTLAALPAQPEGGGGLSIWDGLTG